MIKHFNTYDVYRQSNYPIYPEKQLLVLDLLHTLSRYYTLEYLIDCTTLKHQEKNHGGCVFILHLKFRDLWAYSSADIVKNLIEAMDKLLFQNNDDLRDYIWFLKQKKNDPLIHAVIIFFGGGENFAKLDMISGALQDILPAQKFLTDFKIDIPALIPEHRKPLIMRHVNINDGTMLLDCGFASDFKLDK